MLKTFSNRWNKLFESLPTLYKGALIAGIPVLAITPAIASWSWSRQAKNDAFWWVNHTQEVIRESNNLMRLLVDVETGIRGYAITQQLEFLEPYNKGIETVNNSLVELQRLTQDNPSQQQKLVEMEREIEARLNTLELILKNIEAAPTANNNSSNNQLFIRGKAEMDLLRKSIDLFKEEEWQLLNIRQKRLENIKSSTNILLAASILISLLGYYLAISLYYQSQKQLQYQVQKLDRANQDLQSSNQLIQKRNQELDKFTYIVSHDLKAPLRAINNLSEWIEEDLVDKLDGDTSHNMSLLRNRVRRMNNFIDSLLEYSRAGRIKNNRETINIALLLEEIIEYISPPPEFEIEIQKPMPDLKTDILSLQQVLTNLISNSIKHHHKNDGKIIISIEKKDSIYQFCVADDGRGIAPEDRERIFVIFQTLATKSRGDSTGIGLSIVKKIVEERGGQIWLESELNKGTDFYFTWQP